MSDRAKFIQLCCSFSTDTFLCSPVSHIPHIRHSQVSKSISASLLPMSSGTMGTIKIYCMVGKEVGEGIKRGREYFGKGTKGRANDNMRP